MNFEDVGLVYADTGISQTVYLYGQHGLVRFYPADFAFQSFQWSTDNTNLFSCLEDMLVHLYQRLGLLEHELQTLYLLVGDNGRHILSRIGKQFMDEGIGNQAPDGLLVGTDEDYHGDNDPFNLFLAVAPLVVFPLSRDIVFYV